VVIDKENTLSDIRFDTYYRYDAITHFLTGWTKQFPNLCQLNSIGQSYEGREIWLLTITNQKTGPDTEKPAFWIDGNIHATEVSPSSAALYLIHKLLTGYGEDAKISHLLDTRVFYIVPRLNPDGAEWALADNPKFIRSSTRPYPREDKLDGLYQEDIDGDGRILQMRLKDPHGAWKPHPDHPRLLVPREPDDMPGGDYYRLLPEGRIRNYDGAIIKMAPPLQGLDLNRNFPVHWQPDQSGAGPYPTSEPEVRAAVQFIADHPNITGGITFHTFSAVHLRPLSEAPDDKMPTSDLYTYKAIGRKATELTGYPAVSVFHDFKYDPKDFIKGTFDDWMYEYLGVYAWTTEIWSIQKQAGIENMKYIEWFATHPVEDDVKIYQWSEQHLGDDGYVDWYKFDHPELGAVELGGWHNMITWRNPPYQFLEKEIAPLADFAIFSALISPKLEIHSFAHKPMGDNLHHLRLVVHNTGWLPTNISKKALERKVVRELEVDIELPEGARLVSGELKTKLGQLSGRDGKGATSIWSSDATGERAKAEWVVEAPAGSEIVLTAVHQRAGTVRHTVTL
jgi:murein tripeptide amidase MpaA